MEFTYSDKVKKLQARLVKFMDEIVYPGEKVYFQTLQEEGRRWQIPPVMEEMK